MNSLKYYFKKSDSQLRTVAYMGFVDLFMEKINKKYETFEDSRHPIQIINDIYEREPESIKAILKEIIEDYACFNGINLDKSNSYLNCN